MLALNKARSSGWYWSFCIFCDVSFFFGCFFGYDLELEFDRLFAPIICPCRLGYVGVIIILKFVFIYWHEKGEL